MAEAMPVLFLKRFSSKGVQEMFLILTQQLAFCLEKSSKSIHGPSLLPSRIYGTNVKDGSKKP